MILDRGLQHVSGGNVKIVTNHQAFDCDINERERKLSENEAWYLKTFPLHHRKAVGLEKPPLEKHCCSVMSVSVHYTVVRANY